MKAQPLNLSARAFAALAMLSAVTGATLAAPLGPTAPKANTPAAHVDRNFGKVPLSFEPNQGQTDAAVQFLSRGQGYALFLTPGEAVLELQRSIAKEAGTVPAPLVLRMSLVGANTKAAVFGEQSLPGTANYFIGADSSEWKTAVPTYQRVAYTAVYPGIDLVYYGNQRELEYDFVVAPGADAAKIALQFSGAAPRIDKAGDLVLAVQGEEARFHKPVVYQLDGDRKIHVAGDYQIADGKVGFSLGAYDHSKALVIDPVLSYLTYLGGSSNDQPAGVAVDGTGSAYVVGTTLSTDFPLKNPYNSTGLQYQSNNPHTMFVSKFNATGTALVYSTFLGKSTTAAGIAVDPSGNAYVFATTDDANYPVTAGAYQTLCGASSDNQGNRITGCSIAVATGNNGMAVTKISPDGSQLVYSTFLGGNNGNIAQAIAVDAAGEAYVAGVTNSQCPGPYNPNGTGYQAYDCIANTANASEPVGSGSGDTYGFLVKFNAQGTGLLYSTKIYNHNPVGHYLSGIKLNAIALDAAGNAYVTGNMDANYFITTTPGALQPVKVDPSLPAFVAKFNPAGTAATSLVYSTYLSGTNRSNDMATGIAADAAGNAVVTGYTDSCTFPTTAGSFSNVPNSNAANNCFGGFLTKLNATGSSLVWSTWTSNLGAIGTYSDNRVNDRNDAVAVAADGSIYLTGDSLNSLLYPTVNAILPQLESHFVYVKHFTADGKSVVFSSAIDGTTDATSFPSAVALDSSGNIYLTGYTLSSTWPTTAGAFQKNSANPGVAYYEGFVVKIAPTATTTTTLTLPTNVIAGQSATFTAKVAGPTGTITVPTGTVTFTSGSTSLGTGTLDASGTATYSATSLNATTYNVVASYPGDTSFSPSASTAQALVVAPATATVTLTAPATAAPGASVTLSVKLTGTSGTPSGTVTFKDGATALSTVNLTAGSASYTTSALALGTHTMTAVYSGDTAFGAATSAASIVTINVAAGISFAANPTTLTVPHGTTGTTVITGTPVGGYTGTVTFACGTLPSGATCAFAPAALTFTGNNTAASTTLTVGTVASAALEQLPLGRIGGGIFVALLLLPLGLRRRLKLGHGLLTLTLLALGASFVAALSGCSGSKSLPGTTATPAGTYTVPVNITAGGAPSTLNLTVIVQ